MKIIGYSFPVLPVFRYHAKQITVLCRSDRGWETDTTRSGTDP